MPSTFAKFNRHGLGDCVHFAHLVQMYRRRGYDVNLQVERNKEFVWNVSGANYVFEGDMPDHVWGYPFQFEDLGQPDYLGNKAAYNIGKQPFPEIEGSREELWDELCNVRLSAAEFLSESAKAEAAEFIAGLPRPIIAIHASGTNWRERKSMSVDLSFGVITQLMKMTEGSVISLDWDSRDPIVASPRCKPITSWGRINPEQLCALYELCDLMIGIDSGPFHLAAMTNVPTVGVFRTLHPVRCCLPSPRATYLVPSKHAKHWESRLDRWNLQMYREEEPSVMDVVIAASSILTSPGGEKINSLSRNNQMRSIAGRYLYRRVGHDERPMRLDPDGLISEGSGGSEQRWIVRGDQDNPGIEIFGKDGPICLLQKNEDHVWRGQWNRFERMQIELISIPENPSLPVRFDDGGISENGSKATAQSGEFSGRYEYNRIGHDRRIVEFKPDGTIGEGRGECEERWCVRNGTLFVMGKHGVILEAKQNGEGVFRGQWLQFEKMLVEFHFLGSSSRPGEETEVEDTRKFLVLMNWDSGFDDVAAIVLENRKLYAERHGYKFARRDFQGSWGKIQAILEEWEQADWIWWLDADACVTNPAVTLSSLIEDDDAEFVIGVDENGINAGSFLIKTTNNMRELFKDILRRREQFDLPNNCYEQNALACLLWRHNRKVRAIPQRRLNSYPDLYGVREGESESDRSDRLRTQSWQPGDFVMHCPALPNEVRKPALIEACNLTK